MRKGLYSSLAAVLAAGGSAVAAELPAATGPAPAAPAATAPEVSPVPLAGCCDCETTPASRLWLSGEYLLWWVKSGPLTAPLITTGPITAALPGAFGDPSTRLVLGLTNFDYPAMSGVRVGAGYWLDPEQTVGVEVRGFLLDKKTTTLSASSNAAGNPALIMPILNVATGAFERFTIAESDLRTGHVDIPSTTRLWGAEANGVFALPRGANVKLAALAGFRYLDLRETMDVIQNSTALPFGDVVFGGLDVLAPSNVVVVDSFRTRNQFYGGQIGGRADVTYGKLFGGVSAKFAFGDNHQVIDNAGSSTLTIPGARITAAGGRLVAGSNMGHFTQEHFSFVPEVEVKVGYQVTQQLKAFVSYNFLYWTNVVRPGNQVDQFVDKRAIPTSESFVPGFVGMQPSVPFRQSDFWAQGVTFGLQFDF